MTEIIISPYAFPGLKERPYYRKKLSIDCIATEIANEYLLPLELIKKKTRKPEILLARQMGMYLSRLYTKKTLFDIGAFYGGFDHTTVIHAIDAIKRQLSHPGTVLDHYNKLIKRIQDGYASN